MAQEERGTSLVAALEQAAQDYAAFVAGLSDDQFHRRPAEGEWSAAEITGHVSEAPLTFAKHAQRVVAAGGGEVGRPPDDPGRLSAVARLAGRGPQDGAQLVRDGAAEACGILRGFSEADLNVRVRNARLGEPTVYEFLWSVTVEHLRGHLRQAQAAAAD
jgi:hypothetical protein